METESVAWLTSVFGLLSTVVAIWAMATKRRDEGKVSQAQVADLIADAAGDTITMLNERAKTEADARLAAEKRANLKEAKILELQESRAGLIHENQWYREGIQILIAQIAASGKKPNWDPEETKPLLTTSQVEQMITDLLAKNGMARKLKEIDDND